MFSQFEHNPAQKALIVHVQLIPPCDVAGAVHRRGTHARHRVFLISQPGTGDGHGPNPHHSHKPGHHKVSISQLSHMWRCV